MVNLRNCTSIAILTYFASGLPIPSISNATLAAAESFWNGPTPSWTLTALDNFDSSVGTRPSPCVQKSACDFHRKGCCHKSWAVLLEQLGEAREQQLPILEPA